MVGGYGNDTIFSGSDRDSDIKIWGDNRAFSAEEAATYGTNTDLWKYGRAGDGDDIIDVEDNYKDGISIFVYGQGGNDKIIGSINTDAGG